MQDDYLFKPPTILKEQYIPPTADIAWMQKLIEVNIEETKLPDDLKKKFEKQISMYLTTAGMTNLTKGQINEFVSGFTDVWLRFLTFNVKKKYRPELSYLEAYLRELFILNLNKSIGGWQGNHVFEKKITYDVTEKRKDLSEKIKGIFFKKKVKTIREEEEEG